MDTSIYGCQCPKADKCEDGGCIKCCYCQSPLPGSEVAILARYGVSSAKTPAERVAQACHVVIGLYQAANGQSLFTRPGVTDLPGGVKLEVTEQGSLRFHLEATSDSHQAEVRLPYKGEAHSVKTQAGQSGLTHEIAARIEAALASLGDPSPHASANPGEDALAEGEDGREETGLTGGSAAGQAGEILGAAGRAGVSPASLVLDDDDD